MHKGQSKHYLAQRLLALTRGATNHAEIAHHQLRQLWVSPPWPAPLLAAKALEP